MFYYRKLLFLYYFLSIVNYNFCALKEPEKKPCNSSEVPVITKRIVGRPLKPNYEIDRENRKKEIITQFHAQDVKLTATDGTKLDAFLIERKNAQKVIFLCHGYWMSKEFMQRWIKIFQNETLFIIDLRAHGDSLGDLISFGYHETQDVKAGFNFLSTDQKTKNLPVIGLGVSMGGLILLKAAAEGVPFKGLILDSTLTNTGSTLCYLFNFWSGVQSCNCDLIKAAFEDLVHVHIKDDLDPFKIIHNVTIPLLFIHSMGDRMVPYEEINKLITNAPHTKNITVWITPDTTVGHVRVLEKKYDEYNDKVKHFLNSL